MENDTDKITGMILNFHAWLNSSSMGKLSFQLNELSVVNAMEKKLITFCIQVTKWQISHHLLIQFS